MPEKVSENDHVKIMWEFNIQTDKKLEHKKPGTTVHDTDSNECLLVEVSCPFDNNINKVENINLEIYHAKRFGIVKA